jgi:hypothetical protein
MNTKFLTILVLVALASINAKKLGHHIPGHEDNSQQATEYHGKQKMTEDHLKGKQQASQQVSQETSQETSKISQQTSQQTSQQMVLLYRAYNY